MGVKKTPLSFINTTGWLHHWECWTIMKFGICLLASIAALTAAAAVDACCSSTSSPSCFHLNHSSVCFARIVRWTLFVCFSGLWVLLWKEMQLLTFSRWSILMLYIDFVWFVVRVLSINQLPSMGKEFSQREQCWIPGKRVQLPHEPAGPPCWKLQGVFFNWDPHKSSECLPASKFWHWGSQLKKDTL